MPLTIGLPDFADPTLLLLGDAASLEWLADQIASRQVIDLAQAPLVHLKKLELVLKPVDIFGRLERQGAGFIWGISPVEANQFAQQLRELAASNSPAHAYLDSESNEAGVQVMASKDEYNVDAVFEL